MSEDNFNKLKKKRAALRTAVTKIIKDLESLLLQSDPELRDLEENLEILKNNVESLKIVDNELEPLFKLEEFDTEFLKSEEYRQKVVKCNYRTCKRIEELKCNSSGISVSNQSNSSTERETKSNETVRIRLPELTITKFYGDLNTWLTFWNSFESAIHKNDSLDKINKFNYLKTYLGGSALNTVEGLPITAANYDSAINLLKERFAKTDILIHTHINNILQAKPLKFSNDVRSFRKFYDSICIELRCLENLGQSLENLSSVLCPLILKSLPQDILIEISRKSSKNAFSNIKDLVSVLAENLDSRERAEAIKGSDMAADGRTPAAPKIKNRGSRDEESYKRESKHFSSSELANTAVEEKIMKACVFCEDFSHSSHRCPIAEKLPNNEKVDILRRNGVCFRCLQNKGHISKFCDSSIFCSHCNAKHSTIMCNRMNSENRKGMVKTVQEVENKALSNQNNHSEVYLQTLVVGVAGRYLKGYLRLLIDSGSQNTYVSQYAAKTLGLKKLGTERIKHGLFGGVAISEDHNRYELKLSSLDGQFQCQLEALDQKKICSPLPKIKDGKLIEVLENKGIFLNDNHANENRCLFEENPEEIHLLLGADAAAQLFTERIEHFSEDGIAAFETKLGWTLMGKINKNTKTSNSLSALSLSLDVSDANLHNLCHLDTLRNSSDLLPHRRKNFISDPLLIEKNGRQDIVPQFQENDSNLHSGVEFSEENSRLKENGRKYSDVKKLEDKPEVEESPAQSECRPESSSDSEPNDETDCDEAVNSRSESDASESTEQRPKRSCDEDGEDFQNERRRALPNWQEEISPLEEEGCREARNRCFIRTGGRSEVIHYAPCGKKLRYYPEVVKYPLKNDIKDLGREDIPLSTKMNVEEFLGKGSFEFGIEINRVQDYISLTEQEIVDIIEEHESTKGRSDVESKKTLQQISGEEQLRCQSKSARLQHLLKQQAKFQATLEAKLLSQDPREQDLECAQEEKRLQVSYKLIGFKFLSPTSQQITVERLKDHRRKISAERSRQCTIFVRTLENRKKEEEKERKRKEILFEKRMNREKKLGQRRIELDFLRELKILEDDMMIRNLRYLSTLNRIPGKKLCGQVFVEILLDFEFFQNFGKICGFEAESLISLDTLQTLLKIADEKCAEEPLYAVHHLLVCVIDNPSAPHNPEPRTVLGQNSKDTGNTGNNVSEIYKLYFIALDKKFPVLEWLQSKPFPSLNPSPDNLQRGRIIAMTVENDQTAHAPELASTSLMMNIAGRDVKTLFDLSCRLSSSESSDLNGGRMLHLDTKIPSVHPAPDLCPRRSPPLIPRA